MPIDDDPRWKQIDDWKEKLDREKEKEFQRKDRELEQNLQRSVSMNSR